MLNLALWLKANSFKPDQVQAFLPSPMATATAMYHSERNPLAKISRKNNDRSRLVFTPKRKKQRDLHKAFLRYHDPENWPLLRDALKQMGRPDLIGSGPEHLVPDAKHKNASGREPARKRRFSSERKPSPRRKPK